MRLLLGIHQLDVRAFIWCMHWPVRPHLMTLSRRVSRLADGPFYALVAGGLLILHPAADDRWFLALLVAGITERLIYLVTKNLFRRNRPQEAIDGFESLIRPSDRFSFPSGHTSGAFLFAWVLSQLFPALLPLWYTGAVSVGLARIFLGVHFPTDTVVGAILGTSVAFLTFSAFAL